MKPDELGNQEVPKSHFVADNVDHNLRTLDGLLHFPVWVSYQPQFYHLVCLAPTNGQCLVRRVNKPMKASEDTHDKCALMLTCPNADTV